MNGIFRRLTLLAATIASAAFLLSGCSGDDGATGANGANGVNAVASLTDESCVVCHNANDVASVEIVHGFTNDALNFNTRSKPRFNERNFVATITQVEATAANLPKITFNVKLGGVNYTTLTKEYLSRIIIADQVPAGVGTNTFGSPYWENWAYEAGGSTTAGSIVTFDATGAAAGNYSITLPKAFGVASASNSNVLDYNVAHPQRIYVRVATPTDSTTASTHAAFLLAFPNGYSDVLRLGLNGVGNAAAVKDIASVPAAGNIATLLADPENQYVTIEACRKCHGPQLNGAAHGSGYVDTLACVMCHSPLSGAGASPFYLPKFIHQIHAAIDVPEFPTRILGAGYTGVTYPQAINNCVVCHTNSGKVLGLGDKIDNWKNNPTAEICGSCHTGANFTTGVGHAGGAQVNGSCAGCHPALGTVGNASDIVTAHSPAPAVKNVPEYDVDPIAITAPANGTHYVAGETPTVTVTLKDHGGAAVPGTLYTSASHAAGSTVPGKLSKASLYVYGPRANAKPVLTKAAATLSATGVPTQAQKLFVDATNPEITTNASGFSYKLTIPAGMTAGTYMIRFIAANYGYVSDTDYKIDSTALRTIQIGTATAEPKLSGSNCGDCHGAENFAGHNARHSAVFDTDQCISCHDKSGNFASPLDNRVHAIHSASTNGDLKGIDWKTISYPQGIPTFAGEDTVTGILSISANTGAARCITCHTSTSTTYKTSSVSQRACIGCHADKRGAKDHMIQMGGK